MPSKYVWLILCPSHGYANVELRAYANFRKSIQDGEDQVFYKLGGSSKRLQFELSDQSRAFDYYIFAFGGYVHTKITSWKQILKHKATYLIKTWRHYETKKQKDEHAFESCSCLCSIQRCHLLCSKVVIWSFYQIISLLLLQQIINTLNLVHFRNHSYPVQMIIL